MQNQPERMKIIDEDADKITMLDHFEGRPVRYYKNKATQEIYVNADDMAKILGFKDQHELLSQDATLDVLNEEQKLNPNKPFLTHL